MKKLFEVEEAKALMMEATDWSLFRWLFEKRRVRETADQANAALDKLNKAVKSRWSGDVKAAYNELSRKSDGVVGRRTGEPASQITDSQIRLYAKKVKRADDAARRARIDAEEAFDEAERLLNTAMAREGCQKAIHQWELDEKAIRAAEAPPASTGHGSTAHDSTKAKLSRLAV
ncbi:MAG: hypothetical protein ABSF93_16280 [Candidatus Sulfotelmatobacter sp.]|jgi:hypothetical protein